MMAERRDKVNYYLDLAEVVAQRGTCLRRRYGAVIVKNDEVISTGYTARRALRIVQERACGGQCDYQRGKRQDDWQHAVLIRDRGGNG